MASNIQSMHSRLTTLGVGLRPHVKTNKSIAVTDAVIQRLPKKKIAVSTLREANYFLGHGIEDIMYAVGIVPAKLTDVAELMRRGGRISLILDDRDVAEKVCAMGLAQGLAYRVYIELDVDGHRSGVEAGDPSLLAIADVLHNGAGATLGGVMTHAGGSYACDTTEAIAEAAEQERRRSVEAAELLRRHGYPCPEVSVGSTPTATFAKHLEGITEVRAGVYVFQDLFQAGLGCCTIDAVALSVLATVTGHKKRKNLVIVDAGWMAMSRDRGTAAQRVDQGYGLVLDKAGTPLDDMVMVAANQEHGILTTRNDHPVDFAKLPIGTKVRILPNHACATAAQFDAYIVHAGDTVVQVWPRIKGW